MTTLDQPLERAEPRAAKRRAPRPSKLFANWWRHAVAIVGVVVALFPIAYVASAAFNADQSLSGASLVPRAVTLDNFTILFNDPSTHYWRWIANSLIVATANALFTVLLASLAAYAFSRFRFRGRRMGMMMLLLIQMFPQFLAIVAIYLILLSTGEVFSFLGLNSLTALTVVYLGGAVGVQAWIMKGFFDTIPTELDESARVDGATAAQIFWGVVLPLAAPVLAVIAILAFVGTLNEFVIASALLQQSETYTLPVGLRAFIADQYAEKWGPFAAGVLIAAIPVMALVLAFQRFFIRGLTAGAVKG